MTLSEKAKMCNIPISVIGIEWCGLSRITFFKNIFSFSMLRNMQNATYSIRSKIFYYTFRGKRKEFIITEHYKSRVSNAYSPIQISKKSKCDRINEREECLDFYEDDELYDFDELDI